MADIQIEEQNHAEMLWKYKTANGMAEIKYKTIEFSTKCKTGLPEYRQSCFIGLVAGWNKRSDCTCKLRNRHTLEPYTARSGDNGVE